MRKNEYPGKFVVFEGLDGSGQSTQAKLLWRYLEDWPFDVLLTKEPTTDSEFGKEAREVLRGRRNASPRELQILFALDRGVHLEEIIVPALIRGCAVVSDRYFVSSEAFGAADGVDLDWLVDLNENKLSCELIEPDLTIFLKVRPEVAMSRIEARGEEKERFEKQEKLKIVLSYYEELIRDRYRKIYVLNGEKPIQDISKEVKNIFLRMLQGG